MLWTLGKLDDQHFKSQKGASASARHSDAAIAAAEH
jgi:hypothetical protein